jgi:protein-S-isoprenylcysteine O-methyltransferase Ste14
MLAMGTIMGPRMENVYTWLIPGLWCAWGGYWWLAARDVKTTARQESVASRIAHIGPLIVAALLLAMPRLSLPWLYDYFIVQSPLTYWIGVGLLAGGLAFAVWARVTLGRNWSGTVTVKQDHELIRRGPYRWVRHPIYTGLLFGFLGTAVALAQWRGLLAVVIVFVALWRKLRLEERWMSELFGDQYERYRREVAALLPFLL